MHNLDATPDDLAGLLVAAAIDDGRLTTAEAPAWLRRLTTDPAGEPALAGLASPLAEERAWDRFLNAPA